MTAPAHPPTGHPPAEADRIHTWSIVRVGAASLLLFVAASAAAWIAMRRMQAEMNPAFPVMPAQGGQRKVGMVEQQLFENADRARALQGEKERRLRSTGWVDREAGLVHIPIDRAIDLTLQGERP
jgi:hypothetical protein